MRKPVKERINLDDNLARVIPYYCTYTKTKEAINEVLRQYTGIKTVPEALVQALNKVLRFVEGRKLVEDTILWAMLWTSKGLVALIISWRNKDPELSTQAKSMMDALKVLVHAHMQLTSDSLANVQEVVNNPLSKEVIKRKQTHEGKKSSPLR